MATTFIVLLCLLIVMHIHLAMSCIGGSGPCRIRNLKPIPATGAVEYNPQRCDADGDGQVCSIAKGESFRIQPGACPNPNQVFLDSLGVAVPPGGILVTCQDDGTNRATGEGLDVEGVSEISCGTTPCILRAFKPLPATGILDIMPDQCAGDGEAQACSIANGETFNIVNPNACPGQIFFDNNPIDLPAAGILYTCNNGVNTATGTGINLNGFGSISCGQNPCTIINRRPLPATGISGLEPIECTETGVGADHGQQCSLPNGEEYNIAADACDPGNRLFLDGIAVNFPVNGVNMVCRSDGTMEARDAGDNSFIQANVGEAACGVQTCQISLTRPLPASGVTGLEADDCDGTGPGAGSAQVCTLREGWQFTVQDNACEFEQQLFIQGPTDNDRLAIPATGFDFQCLDGQIQARNAANNVINADVTSLTCGICQALIRGPDDDTDLFAGAGGVAPNNCAQGPINDLCSFPTGQGIQIDIDNNDCALGIWSIRQGNGDCTTFDPNAAVGLLPIAGTVAPINCAVNDNVDVTVALVATGAQKIYHDVVQIQCDTCPLI